LRQAQTAATNAKFIADGLKDALAASDSALECVKKLTGLAKFAGAGAGFVAGVLGLVTAFAGGPSPDDLILADLKEIKGKLDDISSKVTGLKAEIKSALDAGLSRFRWDDLTARVRAVQQRVLEYMAFPTSQGTREMAQEACKDLAGGDPSVVLSELARLMSCPNDQSCMPRALKTTNEYKMVPFFEQARILIWDATLAYEMSSACLELLDLGQDVKDSRRSTDRGNLQAIMERMQTAFNDLRTEFWEKAVSTVVEKVKGIPDANDDDTSKAAQDLHKVLDEGYPFMLWKVYIYEASGSDRHTVYGTDLAQGDWLAQLKQRTVGGFYQFRVGSDSGKNVYVFFRSKEAVPTGDPSAALAGILASECKPEDHSISGLADCVEGKDGVNGVMIVHDGDGLRGFGSPIFPFNRPIDTKDGVSSIAINWALETQDEWTFEPLSIAPSDSTQPAGPPQEEAPPSDVPTQPAPTSPGTDVLLGCMEPFRNDIDLAGGDLPSNGTPDTAIPGAGPRDCCSACSSLAGCRAFTWVPGDRCQGRLPGAPGCCFLKAETGWSPASLPGAISVVMEPVRNVPHPSG
jgi:hypothetical protein